MTKLETLSLVFLFFSLYSNFVFEIKSSEYKGFISSSNVFFLALYESERYERKLEVKSKRKRKILKKKIYLKKNKK